MSRVTRLTRRIRLAAAAFALVCAPASLSAQWLDTYEQAYLRAPHNWRFRDDFASADRLFNAFDYGHAILSETLWGRADAAPAALETEAFDFLTRELLVRPPRLPLAERAIAPQFSRLAPEIMAMFDWAHVLHRQVYDVLADSRLDSAAKDTEVARLVRYYRTRPDLAFSGRPKSMALMQEQPYSLAFRQAYPKFNGLIWAYHWLQMGLYEPLVTRRTHEAQAAGVAEALARFRMMLADPPRTLPYVMPMTPAVAPAFSARFPQLAVIFDNLHSLHDVVSDILANPSVARDSKRRELMKAAAAYRDDTTHVMTIAAYVRMSGHMGLENMGGAPLGQSGPLPTPTVARGYVMKHDVDGNMIGEHTAHAMPMTADSAIKLKADEHAAHNMPMPADTAAKAVAAPAAAPVAAAHDMAAMDHAAHQAAMKAEAKPALKSALGDSAFAALQARGAGVMGVDQYSSQHVFQDLKDGGRIVLEREASDSAGVATIRAHLREVAAAFTRGDFSAPFATHAQVVPGTDVMAARKSRIRYAMRNRPGGGEVRITTTDPSALKAVRAFLQFQRSDHRAPGEEPQHQHPPA